MTTNKSKKGAMWFCIFKESCTKMGSHSDPTPEVRNGL